MKRDALLGLALTVVFVGGCKSATLEKTGQVKPAAQTAAAPAATAPAAPTQGQATAATVSPAEASEAAARGYDLLQLTATIPQATMDAAEQQATCPRTFLTALFGADFANPHGCVIGQLTPDGLAQKAGLQVGDSIVSCNGTTVTCPNTLLPEIKRSFDGPEPGKVVLVLHRPLTAK